MTTTLRPFGAYVKSDDSDALNIYPFAFNFDNAVSAAAPEITVTDPADQVMVDGVGTYDFGTADEDNTSVFADFAVTNDGDADLIVSSITVPAEFAVRDDEGGVISDGFTLEADESITMRLRLLTENLGSHSGTFIINSNDADEATFEINVQGAVEVALATDGVDAAAVAGEVDDRLAPELDTPGAPSEPGGVVPTIRAVDAAAVPGEVVNRIGEQLETLDAAATPGDVKHVRGFAAVDADAQPGEVIDRIVSELDTPDAAAVPGSVAASIGETLSTPDASAGPGEVIFVRGFESVDADAQPGDVVARQAPELDTPSADALPGDLVGPLDSPSAEGIPGSLKAPGLVPRYLLIGVSATQAFVFKAA